MFYFVRFATVVYVLVVFTGGYVAVSTLKGMWQETHRFQRLASMADHGANVLDDTLTAFEPAAGDAVVQ